MIQQSDFTRIDEAQLFESLHEHFCVLGMYADLGAQGAGLKSRLSTFEATRSARAILKAIVDDLHEIEAARHQREQEGRR